MDKNRLMLLWVAGGAGVILLYAAYKGKSPSGILTSYVGQKPSGADPNAVANAVIVPPSQTSAQFVPDANGVSVDVPPAYSSNPDLFIPPVGSGG